MQADCGKQAKTIVYVNLAFSLAFKVCKLRGEK